jgi:hypothetical protein
VSRLIRLDTGLNREPRTQAQVCSFSIWICNPVPIYGNKYDDDDDDDAEFLGVGRGNVLY